MPKKIILDCDPGHDDAVAIMLAVASEEINLLGITCVGGNTTLENTKLNALKICSLIDRDLSNSFVRLEVICDREGFWLKPHCDIKEKLMSSIVFVNPHDESENLGTDFYDKKLNKIKTVPYKNNYGYFFTSGPNTWHGMEKKEIKKERRCIQINYVTFAKDWKVK